MRKHYVTFLSPGTFVSETTRKSISKWNPIVALKLAKSVTECYGAKPYGFQFTTVLTAPPVCDGEGGKLKVQEKEIAKSGIFYIGGKLRTVDEVSKKADFNERTLLFNMLANDWSIVIENCNSYKITQPFNEDDLIIGPRGGIVERGNDPKRVVYRAQKKEEHRVRYID